jgi:membrane protein YdbS with pleckstrin-like domain
MTEEILPRGAVRDPDGTVVFRPSPRLRAYYLFLLILVVWIGIFPWLIFAAFTFPGELTLMLVVPLLVLVLLARWWIPKSWASLSFRFTATELVCEKGVLRSTRLSLPYTRIRDIDIECGVVCRYLGIAGLGIRLDDGGVIRIPGVEEPELIREILKKIIV